MTRPDPHPAAEPPVPRAPATAWPLTEARRRELAPAFAESLAPLLGDRPALELRAPECRVGDRTRNVVRVFTGPGRLAAFAAEALRAGGRCPGVYVLLNRIPPLAGRRGAAGDADVDRRLWLPVDVDAGRPKDASATVAEKAAAYRTAVAVRAHLAARGWPPALFADSGNGYHLFARVDLPNDAASRDLVRDCLRALAARFDGAGVTVDPRVFNASRLMKVPGTPARKGADTAARPHRVGGWVDTPPGVAVVPRGLLEELAAEAPPEDPAAAAPRPAARADGAVPPPADDDQVARLCERCYGGRFARLWAGDTSGHGGDHSRADLALTGYLAWVIGPDEERILATFRRSGLYRDKWDQVRSSDGRTYGRMTVRKALSTMTSFRGDRPAPPPGRAAAVDPPAPDPPPEDPVPPDSDSPPAEPSSGSDSGDAPDDPPAAPAGPDGGLPMAWNNPARLADAVLARTTVRCVGRTAFVSDGVRYAVTGDDAFAALVRRAVEGEAAAEFRRRQTDDRPPGAVPAVTARLVHDTLGAVRARVQLPDGTAPGVVAVRAADGWRIDADPPPVLAAANGLIDLASARDGPAAVRLLPHTPDRFHLAALPGRFDPHAPPPARWLAFLADAVPDDPERAAVLQEAFGACLHPTLAWKHVTALVGDGDNGKSVVLTALRALLGPANVAAVELAQLGQSRFAAFPLLGKLANLAGDEAAFDSADEGRLRQLTGGDLCAFEQKGKTPIFARNTAKLVFSCNALPAFADRSEAMWRRLVPIPFDVRVPADRQDPTLLTDGVWRAEWAGLLNWALAGLARYLRRGRRTTCPAVERLLETHRLDSNPARAFLVERCRLVPGAVTPAAVLYAGYRRWCEANGYRAVLASRPFGRDVARQFPDARSQGTHRGGQAVRAWYGLEALPDADD